MVGVAGRAAVLAGLLALSATAGAQTPATSASPAPVPSPTPSPSPAVVRSIPGVNGLPTARAAAVDALLTAAVTRLGIPGLSAAVVTDRELRWSTGLGVTDVENDVGARPDSVYRFASVSKPITATAVLQLVEQKKLDLDAPIRTYVPAFPEKPWPVTVRQLLSHQSGVRNWTQEEFRNTRRYPTLAEALVPFRDDELLFEPGTRTQYTSFGFTLLGAAVEGASATNYAEYLQTTVFAPAGMTATRVDDVRAIVPRRVRGYQHSDGALLNSILSDTSNRTPGGGLCGTAEDLARFASAILKGTLLRPATLRVALTPQKLTSGRPTGYALGWVVAQSGRRREAYHTGAQPQVSTVLYLLPDSGVAVVILANLEGIEKDLLEVARQIAAILV